MRWKARRGSGTVFTQTLQNHIKLIGILSRLPARLFRTNNLNTAMILSQLDYCALITAMMYPERLIVRYVQQIRSFCSRHLAAKGGVQRSRLSAVVNHRNLELSSTDKYAQACGRK